MFPKHCYYDYFAASFFAKWRCSRGKSGIRGQRLVTSDRIQHLDVAFCGPSKRTPNKDDLLHMWYLPLIYLIGITLKFDRNSPMLTGDTDLVCVIILFIILYIMCVYTICNFVVFRNNVSTLVWNKKKYIFSNQFHRNSTKNFKWPYLPDSPLHFCWVISSVKTCNFF